MAKTPTPTADDKLVEECHREFKVCEDRESETRRLWKADLRFANGDPDNGYQWDDTLRRARELDKRPCLTTNKVKQHNRQITNDARQNKPAIRVYPVDDGADKKTAEILNGVIRHIESNSNADTAYDMALEFAVDAGLGFWRVITEYASDDSFDQEIYIKAVPNPLNVYLGRHAEFDGSDATRAFVFEDMPREDFEAKYPGNKDAIGWPQSANDASDWLGEKNIRVCEYFRIEEETDTLYALEDGTTARLSEVEDKAEAKRIQADDTIKKRKVSTRKCCWYLVAGDKIIERGDWPGRYIPIVRVVGEEVEIDGKVQRKGHTRAMKDAQRMYNYWSSAGVEYGALQGKQPYLIEVEAVNGLQEYWDNLNTSNLSYVPWNGKDANGNPNQKPERQMPPVSAPMYMEGMRVAAEEMKMASGQYDASMGAKSNETSGRAILARQREGDNATFHFIDNEAISIRYTGKILVDLIPKVYDTARVVRILGEDGTEDMAQLNPDAKVAYAKERDELTGEVQEIYNPGVGRYDVTVAVGPSYSTRRQEAFQALSEISARNPQLMQVAGDIVMRAADFPMADQLADRLKKTIPAELMEEDDQQQIPPQVQAMFSQLTQQMQAMQESGAALQRENQDLRSKQKSDDDKNKIEAYRAETERMQLVAPAIPPEAVQAIVLQTVQAVMQQSAPMEEPEPVLPMEQPYPGQLPDGGFPMAGPQG